METRTTLYVVGGPARVGKSAVARALAARAEIGWLSTDVLSAVVEVAGVTFESRWSVDDTKRQAGLFFPYLRRFAEASAAFHGSYCLEGISILPEHVAALASDRIDVRACFLGDESMSGDRILAYAQGFWPEGPGRQLHLWVTELGDEGRARYADEVRAVSAFVRAECERYGVPYVDMGLSFQGGVARAVEALLDAPHPDGVAVQK